MLEEGKIRRRGKANIKLSSNEKDKKNTVGCKRGMYLDISYIVVKSVCNH